MKYFEHYRCGCVSENLPKSELPGYCPRHGESVKRVYPIYAVEASREIAETRAEVATDSRAATNPPRFNGRPKS